MIIFLRLDKILPVGYDVIYSVGYHSKIKAVLEMGVCSQMLSCVILIQSNKGAYSDPFLRILSDSKFISIISPSVEVRQA